MNTHASTNSNPRYYNVARPIPFDLDGDGIVEAIVLPLLSSTQPQTNDDPSSSSSSSTASWTLQVMDLKPLHATHDSYIDDEGVLPIYPKTIFTSNAKPFIPVKMITGQIFVTSKTAESSMDGLTSMKDSTLDYYCGKSWQEANDICHLPCPTGLQSDCPDGYTCFADTSCDEKKRKEKIRKEQDGYVKNVLDGIPSVATIWSNGNVTLHGITRAPNADMNSAELDLVEMWSVNPFGLRQELTSWIEFVEVDLLMENNAPIGKYGALVIAARYRIIDREKDGHVHGHGHEKEESSIYFALDAFTGEIIWQNDAHHRQHSNNHKSDIDTDHHLPLSSMGRRRSRLSQYTEAVQKVDESESSEECLHHFRKLILDETAGVLPHSFWHQHGDRGSLEWDTKLVSSHFDRKRWRKKQTQNPSWLAQELSGNANRKVKRQLHFGHPNVAIFHNRHGINVLSLRNGKQVCHLSLLENMLHADINRDGTVDTIEIVARTSKHDATGTGKSLCNAVITSGTSETIIDICNDRDGQSRNEARQIHGLSAAPPLIVETYDSDIMTHDIIIALNNGLVKRYDTHGRRKWTARGSFDDIPSWDQGPGAHNGYLFLIDFDGTSTYHMSAAAQRPILLSGDDKMAIFTAGGGRLLDKAEYPQSFVGKPILQDLNGDGTTDVLITTVDGVWGYCIDITNGGSAFLNILNGLLASFVVVAFLSSYFDDPSIMSRRSTGAQFGR